MRLIADEKLDTLIEIQAATLLAVRLLAETLERIEAQQAETQKRLLSALSSLDGTMQGTGMQ